MNRHVEIMTIEPWGVHGDISKVRVLLAGLVIRKKLMSGYPQISDIIINLLTGNCAPQRFWMVIVCTIDKVCPITMS